MATLNPIARFLAPLLRRPSHRLALHFRPLPHAHTRHASSIKLSSEFQRRLAAQQQKSTTSPSSTTPVIPQPDKYRPPSHGKRTPNKKLVGTTYGPALTEEDKKRMATKKYPGMMSPEGSFSYWFFHNKGIHLWITMGILFSLAMAAGYMDFMHKTVYASLLPERKDFLRHPIASTQRFIEVYKMHLAQQSQMLSQQRLKKLEDVEKRKQYRQARIREAEERGEEYVEDPRFYVGEDGIRRRRVKRWFGIWE